MGIVLLALAGFGSVDDPEKVMPLVLQNYLPAGIRGFVIAGLLAAFMSTFSSTVNSGASYIVRDLWQPFFQRNAGQRALIRASYAANLGIVAVGIAIGFQAESIAEIWNWMMMALGAGVLIPNVLRWYWWRMNGWGYAAGALAGTLFSLVALFMPDAPMFIVFPPICLGSLAASIIVTMATRPVPDNILDTFYTHVRPFGVWGPVRTRAALPLDTAESAPRALLNTALGIIAVTGCYLAPHVPRRPLASPSAGLHRRRPRSGRDPRRDVVSPPAPGRALVGGVRSGRIRRIGRALSGVRAPGRGRRRWGSRCLLSAVVERRYRLRRVGRGLRDGSGRRGRPWSRARART